MHDEGGNAVALAEIGVTDQAELDQEISTIGTYLSLCTSQGVSDNNPSVARYRRRLAELQKLRSVASAA